MATGEPAPARRGEEDKITSPRDIPKMFEPEAISLSSYSPFSHRRLRAKKQAPWKPMSRSGCPQARKLRHPNPILIHISPAPKRPKSKLQANPVSESSGTLAICHGGKVRGRPQPEGRRVLVQFQCERGRIQSILGSTFPRIGIELAKKREERNSVSAGS